MKQTRTTLKELTAMYRAVLRHGILCNAIALGLIATAPAMAETVTSQQVIQDTQVLSGVSASNLSNDPGAVYWVYQGDLTLNDSSFVGNTAAGSYGLGGVIYNDGTATINTSTFTGNSSTAWGGAIASYGNLTISDSTFGGTGDGDINTSGVGGAIVAGGGSLTINNGTGFYNNKATGTDGGAVWTSDAVVSVSDTTFDGNTAAQNGGAVYKSGAGNASVKDSVFTANVATGEAGIGGAVVIDQYNTGTVLFDNVTFGDGTAAGANHADEAGAIWLGTAGTIENSTFNYNTAHDGGAVVTGGSGKLTLNNSTFLNNVADGNGGAIATRKKDAAGTSFLHITGDGTDATMFANNSAANGGAIYTGTNDTTIANTKFTGNTATVNGGAIYNENVLTIDNATFERNSATGNSGAIAGAVGSTLALNNVNFDRNSADWGGAMVARGTTSITGGSFFGNSSNDGGGAIYLALTAAGNPKNTLNINGTEFEGNSTAGVDLDGGGAIGSFSDLTLKNATFTGNHVNGTASNGGGALFLGSESKNDIDNTTFTSNTSATNGGAISMRFVDQGNNAAATLDITNASFASNSATDGKGGAIYNTFHNDKAGDGYASVSGSTFAGNSAYKGGAIYNEGAGTTDTVGGVLKLTDSTFTGNSADRGGTIYNVGTLTLNGGSIENSKTLDGHGGAVYNDGGTLNITNATLNDNKTSTDKSGGAIYNNTDGVVVIAGGEITNNKSGNNGGAVYSAKNGNVTITGTSVNGNSTVKNGGAIYNNKGILVLEDAELIGNSAEGKGAGIYNNEGVITLTDTVFKDNVVDTVLNASGYVNGGAGVYNFGGSVTVNAINRDITFSGNKVKVDGVIYENDIYNSNSGSLTLNAAADRILTLDGGIDGGGAGTMLVNAGAANTGVVKIAGTLNGQNVTVAHGELHLIDDDPMLVDTEGAYLAGSTINVASGATINTIDDAIQDLSSVVTLADGAGVKGDIDYIAGLADTYAAADGANITYKLANALNLSGMQYGAAKEIRVTNTGATVDADANFAWYNAVDGLTLTSGGTGTGTVLVSGTAGGINTAVDDTNETVQEIAYTASAASETFDGADNVIQNADFTITGNGNETTDNTITFATDMVVDGTSTLSLNDVVLAKTDDEAIENREGGVLNVTESRIGVNIRNFGTMVSDPTYYDAQVVNAGTATFTDDVFENGSSLTNSATVNLSDTQFLAGSTLTGLAGNVLNIAGTGNVFAGTSTGNNVKLASGANYTGTLSNGVVDARNGGIDTITGAVSGGDLYVDASLKGAGSIDTFAGTTGSTIKSINVTSTEYGSADSISMNVGGATLDEDLQITGAMNYYTKVEKDGDNLVFSDKLINKSTLDTTLADYATSDDLTTGLAGKATTTALTGVSDRVTTLENAGYQTASDVNAAISGATIAQSQVTGLSDALAGKQATIDAEHKLSASLVSGLSGVATSGNFSDLTVADNAIAMSKVDGLSDALAGKANAATTLAGYGITDAYTKGEVDTAITAALTNGSDAYQTASQVSTAISNATIAMSKVNGLSDALDGKANASTTLAGYGITDAYTKGEVDTALAGKANASTTLAGYGITDAYTKGEVDTAITAALTNAGGQGGAYQTASAVETKIADTAAAATYDNSTSGLAATTLQGAIDETVSTVATINTNMGKVHGLVSSENGAKTLHETQNGTTSTNVVSGEYKGNLAVGTTVEDHLIALDNTIGMVSELDTTNGVLSNTASVATNLQNLDTAAASNAQNIQKIVDGTTTVAKATTATNATNAVNATNDGQGRNIASTYATLQLVNDTVGDMSTVSGTYVSNTASVATNLNQLSAAIDSIAANSVAGANAYTDQRVEALDKDLSAGVAGAVALSSVAVSGVERGEVSVGAGYGYFNGQSAAAFGAAMGLSNRWSVNAGAGISNSDVSFRAGTNYKFKLF